MADTERKNLVWDIRKGLFALSPDQLFQIASNVAAGPGKDPSELSSGDAEGCFEYINSFMYSKTLLEAEDSGMGELLALKDIVDDLLHPPSGEPAVVETTVEASQEVPAPPPPQESRELDAGQPSMDNNSTSISLSQDDVFKIISDYEKVNKTLQGLMTNPTVQPSQEVPTPKGNARPPASPVVSLRDLPYLPRREFKVQGGQIGDHTSDINYNSICRQIEEGIKENFTESDIVRGVLKIIRPGDFKDMLVNKDDMTVVELKGFLQSHLGERNSTELFQELICAKQKENETTQQFLYRVIGLKQRILFESRKLESEIKYTPETVQGVFLHTVYQGIGHKDNDIRRELKPLLTDQTVTDEAILKHLMKVTSEESERHRRLGPTQRQKHINAHVAHVDEAKVKQTRKETVDQKPKTDTVKELSEKIDALTKIVDSLAETVQKERPASASKSSATRNERLYACAKCVQAGSQSCNHCFSCGEEGHRAIGCLKRLKQPGNESRLLRRDKRLRELETQLMDLEASRPSARPALKFKIENFFCMGSPLAVFLALRGIRPGASGHQDHILPTSICSRLFNVFHPTDPVAYCGGYLCHHSTVCSATNPTPYDELRPTFLTPVKEPTPDTDSIPSTSPVLPRRHYGESITSLGKASILGAASIGKGIGGILFPRFSRSNSQPSVSLGAEGVATAEEEEQKRAESQSAYGLSSMVRPTSPTVDTSLELERRIDFELREGLVESRCWSTVTSHTSYWCSHDIALFLLSFIYKPCTSPAQQQQTVDEGLEPD